MAAMFALVEAGDEVVLPRPWWVSLPAQVHLAGARPVGVETRAREQFALRAAPLLEACTARTRVILVNSPCNPTGAVLPAEELERLAAGAQERGLQLIVDATYERFDYRFDGWQTGLEKAMDVVRRYRDDVLWVSSMSKTYAMTGWRVGYALGAEPVIAGLRAVQSHTTTHPTSFAMAGAAAALRGAQEEARTLIAHCRGQRERAVAALQAIPGLACHLPPGSFYLLVDVRSLLGSASGLGDSDAFSEALLEAQGVVTVSGAAFAAPGFVRLSVAVDQATLDEGLEKIAAFVRALPSSADSPGPSPDTSLIAAAQGVAS